MIHHRCCVSTWIKLTATTEVHGFGSGRSIENHDRYPALIGVLISLIPAVPIVSFSLSGQNGPLHEDHVYWLGSGYYYQRRGVRAGRCRE